MVEQSTPALEYFRIKTEYTAEALNGELKKVKTEELVLASCYTDAEKVACEIAKEMNRYEFGSVNIEVIKEKKINDIIYNEILAKDNEPICGLVRNFFTESEDTGVGLYSVKIVFITIDEKTAKEKRITELHFVPASSSSDAISRINKHFDGSSLDFVIRETKFDKAEAIYWPNDVHLDKVAKFQLP